MIEVSAFRVLVLVAGIECPEGILWKSAVPGLR
jgi:hypothetical protein